MSHDGVAWEPHGYYRTKSNIAQFVDEYDYDSYAETRPESEDELARFWDAAVEDTGIVWETPYEQVLDTSDGYPFTTWFVGGELNVTRTLLDKWVSRAPDRPAYIWEGENGETVEYTYAELEQETNRVANALRSHGVGPGDVVGILFPLHPNAIIASLACFKIGAIQTHLFAGYGETAIKQRLDDSGAELVFLADGYQRTGTAYDIKEKFNDVVELVPDVETVVSYEHIGTDTELEGVSEIRWSEFVDGQSTEAETEVMAADDPAFIAYSSGTTGKPKGTIHTHGSMLAAGTKEAKYHFDISGRDVFTWVTDFGWLVVPAWIIGGAQALGATVVLPGGAPNYPEGDRLWNLVERHGITTLGISPTGVRGMRAENETPRADHDLSTLRTLASTGEPWDRGTWTWYFEAVGDEKLPIINSSGGTELGGGVLAPSPLTPIKPGTLYGPQAGVSAAVYDEAGNENTEGNLVLDLPFPGMTHSLTSGDERYLEEYWEDFDDAWNQNDWVEIDEDGFWYITGRADDTMNVSGRRVTAPEIEEAVLEHADIDGAAVIDIEDEDGNTVPVAFVTLFDDSVESIEEEVREAVADALGAPFRPKHVYAVDALPRTQTGKIPRSRIKSVYLEGAVGDVSTLENGAILDEYPRLERT